MPQFSYLTLFLITVGIYFMWMDVALYFNLQQVLPAVSPAVRPLATNLSDYSYTPFNPITVKLLFQGPTIHYIDTPLAYWTVEYTGVAQTLSPNSVSIIGVGFALLSAKMLLSESLRVRQFGVLMFKIRDFMDSLDGSVARAQRSQVALTVEPGTFGYYFDGLCDAMGDFLIFVAIIIFCNRNYSIGAKHGNGLAYLRLDTKMAAESALPIATKLPAVKRKWPCGFCRKYQAAIILLLWITGQALVSSMAWNHSLIMYRNLLETDMVAQSPEGLLAQNGVLKSPALWMVVYFWRFLNPHSITQFILIAILYNKTFQYLSSIQYLGYIPILSIAFVSELYGHYAYSSIAAVGNV